MLIAIKSWGNSAPWVGATLEGLPCNGGGQGFGPYDYSHRAGLDEQLHIVEGAHFTPEVENLLNGKSSTLEGDLNYTLRAWPNHHRALLSIIKYQLNINKKITPGKLSTPPECYLQRAIRFSPEDVGSYSLFGHYLRKTGHTDEAAKYYQKALAIDPKNAKVAYSFSFLLIDLKRYEEAVKYAKIAYQQDAKTPNALKQKLEKLGAWKE
ncbi:MAG: tetratricopeptide repeat protein [Methylovulum sp.]|nr:tetratricopeptide repeat protein [Methylovulum sp.]MDD2725353.1 tetratricopeptide repeat protein [Methylovulum sp.]MDD5124448.1 tetratricopeptide repeat protein [Methylovulum sp.]